MTVAIIDYGSGNLHSAAKAFERATDDKFFILVEATDPKFDLEKTKALLTGAGATLVEELEP